MVEYKYRVIDDNNKIEERIFDSFEEAYEYAISSGALLPFIFEYTYKDGIEWDIYDDCPVEDGEDTSEIVWSWDDTWDKEKAISQVKGRHYLEDNIKEPVDEDLDNFDPFADDTEFDDLEDIDINNIDVFANDTEFDPLDDSEENDFSDEFSESKKASRDPKILEAALKEAIKLDQEEDTFTPEEQEEYGIDEFGQSIDSYDEYVHCAWCGDPTMKYEAVNELNMGYLCKHCADSIRSRGEKLTVVDENLEECNLTEKHDDPKLIVARELRQTDMFKDWPENLLYFTVINAYQSDVYGDNAADIDDAGIKARDVKAQDIIDWVGNLAEWILQWGYEFSNNQVKQLVKKSPILTKLCADEYYSYLDDSSKLARNDAAAVNFIFEEESEKDDNLDWLTDVYNEYLAKHPKAVNTNTFAKEKGIDESLSQEISVAYKYASKYYGIPELQQYVEEWYEANYPDYTLPEFAGNVIYSEKYWNEFEAWLKVNKNIDLEAIRNSKNVEEGLTTAPATSDQELQGADCAVVDCQGDNKVVAHSEDEKPLDCKMEKKPLEKPLTEAIEKVKPFLVNCEVDVCDNIIYAKSEEDAIAEVEMSFVENGYYAGDEIYSIDELTADNYMNYADELSEAELAELKDYFNTSEDLNEAGIIKPKKFERQLDKAIANASKLGRKEEKVVDLLSNYFKNCKINYTDNGMAKQEDIGSFKDAYVKAKTLSLAGKGNVDINGNIEDNAKSEPLFTYADNTDIITDWQAGKFQTKIKQNRITNNLNKPVENSTDNKNDTNDTKNKVDNKDRKNQKATQKPVDDTTKETAVDKTDSVELNDDSKEYMDYSKNNYVGPNTHHYYKSTQKLKKIFDNNDVTVNSKQLTKIAKAIRDNKIDFSEGLFEDFEEENTAVDTVDNSINNEPSVSSDVKVEEVAKKVMDAYQTANKHLDTIKEIVYTNLNCPFFSSYIHGLAHTMPERFDKFGDILHTVNMEIPYPTTLELESKPTNISDACVAVIAHLDNIKNCLNEFIKATDESYHGMACAAEACLNDIESEYPVLYRLQAKADEYKEDTVSFDKFVGQYVEHKGDLLESLNEDFDQDLNKDLAAHNTYIEYLQKELKEVEEREAKEKNEFIKLALQRRIETLNNELNSAIPEEVKNKDAEIPEAGTDAVVDAPEEDATEEIPKEPKEEVKESFNNDEQSRLLIATKALGIKTQGDLIKFSKEHGNVKNQELLAALEKAVEEQNK